MTDCVPDLPKVDHRVRNIPERQDAACSDVRCENVFADLRVVPSIEGTTRVEWVLAKEFKDPTPHTFQLQTNIVGIDSADDWEDVGSPADDVFYLEDTKKRLYGKNSLLSYRVQVTTVNGVYYSPPIRFDETLSIRDRLIWRNSLKAHAKDMKLFSGIEGKLLKRRLSGTPCPEGCIDYLTGEIRDPYCSTCYGTGYVNGYYTAVDCVYIAPSQKVRHNNLDDSDELGTVEKGKVIKAKMLAVPWLFEGDIWVDKNTDKRWAIHAIQNIIEVRGVPVVHMVELRLLPYTDVAYKVPA